MRIHRLLCFWTVLIMSQFALAKLPFTNEAFGAVEGTLGFCSHADVKSASKYQDRKQHWSGMYPKKSLRKLASPKNTAKAMTR